MTLEEALLNSVNHKLAELRFVMSGSCVEEDLWRAEMVGLCSHLTALFEFNKMSGVELNRITRATLTQYEQEFVGITRGYNWLHH